MLSSRQQHCLQGIGIRRWRERDALPALEESDEQTTEAATSAEMPVAETAPAILSVPDSVETVTAAPVPDVPVEEPELPRIDITALENWDGLHHAVEACQACALAQNCTRKVPGVGDREADLMIIGEGPGHDEDLRGEPFVGRSGQLLDRMLEAIGFSREQVYITNIVKCRPPSNRDPRPEEARQCRAYLDAQIRQINPRIILSAGRVSAHNLLESQQPVGKLIKQMHVLPGTDIPLKVTYHPAYLLRNPSAKAIAWQDMKLLYRMLQ